MEDLQYDTTHTAEYISRVLRMSRDFYAYCTTHGVELDALHAAEGLDYLEIVGDDDTPLVA